MPRAPAIGVRHDEVNRLLIQESLPITCDARGRAAGGEGRRAAGPADVFFAASGDLRRLACLHKPVKFKELAETIARFFRGPLHQARVRD